MLRRRRSSPEPTVTLADVAVGGHVKFGRDWPTVEVELDPVSVRADWDARSRLLFDAVVSRAWSLDAWED